MEKVVRRAAVDINGRRRIAELICEVRRGFVRLNGQGVPVFILPLGDRDVCTELSEYTCMGRDRSYCSSESPTQFETTEDLVH